MTIAKTMTPPIPAAVANATGVRAETVVLSPFHSASHTAHRSRGIGNLRVSLGQANPALVTFGDFMSYRLCAFNGFSGGAVMYSPQVARSF